METQQRAEMAAMQLLQCCDRGDVEGATAVLQLNLFDPATVLAPDGRNLLLVALPMPPPRAPPQQHPPPAALEASWGMVDLLQQHPRLSLATNSDGDHWTALHHAAALAESSFSAALVEGLLKRGADPHMRDTIGSTPLHIACDAGNIAVVELLLGAGADVNVKCSFNWTPLHYAAKAGHERLAELLMETGAKLEGRETTTGASPMELARTEEVRGAMEMGHMSNLLDGMSF